MQYFMTRKLFTITWIVCLITFIWGVYRVMITGDEGILFAVAGAAMYLFIVPTALTGIAAIFQKTRKPQVFAWIFMICSFFSMGQMLTA